LTKVKRGVRRSITVNAITTVETTLMKTASVATPPGALPLIPHPIFDRVHGASES